jgi:Fe-S cluster biogenesis protein NfuA
MNPLAEDSGKVNIHRPSLTKAAKKFQKKLQKTLRKMLTPSGGRFTFCKTQNIYDRAYDNYVELVLCKTCRSSTGTTMTKCPNISGSAPPAVNSASNPPTHLNSRANSPPYTNSPQPPNFYTSPATEAADVTRGCRPLSTPGTLFFRNQMPANT